MHIALFILYFLLLCLAITRMRFFNASIKPLYLVGLFGIHVALGCVHTWIAFRFYPGHGDIWVFFKESNHLRQQLLADPARFFRDVFSAGAFNLLDTNQPLLDVQYKTLQYINLALNTISFNNLYINTLLFSFPAFGGTMALFKIFYKLFGSPLPAFCVLLLPSVLFWTTVVYKDGVFYMALGFFLYYLLQPGGVWFRKWILLLIFFVLMVISRANALLSLLPALLFFILAEKKSMGKVLAFVITVATLILGVVVFNAWLPDGVLTSIAERQKDFQSLTGGSRIYLPLLEPTPGGFLAVFPTALVNGFFQPLPGQGGKIIYTAFSAELLAVWAIVLFAGLLAARKKMARPGNFGLACLLFALPGMIMIGYMVPFAGAIIRYRSIYLPFLLAPFIHIICRYPVPAVQRVNEWLYRKVMAAGYQGA
ncbi:MAG: hypothetical protein ABI813_05940 [Bacteroidota bacterium]